MKNIQLLADVTTGQPINVWVPWKDWLRAIAKGHQVRAFANSDFYYVNSWNAAPYRPNKLTKIKFPLAEKLLNSTDIFIYIKYGDKEPDTDHNMFMLSATAKQGDFNIYMRGQTPKEIGLKAIENWIKQRIGTNDSITYYTMFSNTPYVVTFETRQ